jgi:hypothetical protein
MSLYDCREHERVATSARRFFVPVPPPLLTTGEARGAESRSDFIHKLRIVLKELNETAVWLELIAECSLVPREKLVGIVAENQELCRIIAASVRTARGAGNGSQA